jgi:hypothetical protein
MERRMTKVKDRQANSRVLLAQALLFYLICLLRKACSLF